MLSSEFHAYYYAYFRISDCDYLVNIQSLLDT
jgi:hypothetical protein